MSLSRSSSDLEQLLSRLRKESNCFRQVEGVTYLISSGLSEEIIAKNVLTFLDSESLKELMALDLFRERFNLTKYYCPKHGTKLEKDIVPAGGKRKEDVIAISQIMAPVDAHEKENLPIDQPSPKKCKLDNHTDIRLQLEEADINEEVGLTMPYWREIC